MTTTMMMMVSSMKETFLSTLGLFASFVQTRFSFRRNIERLLFVQENEPQLQFPLIDIVDSSIVPPFLPSPPHSVAQNASCFANREHERYSAALSLMKDVDADDGVVQKMRRVMVPRPLWVDSVEDIAPEMAKKSS